MMIILL